MWGKKHKGCISFQDVFGHVIHAVWNTISWSHKSCAALFFFVDQKKSSVTYTKDSCEKQSAKITRFRGDLFLPNLANSSCALLHHLGGKKKKL
jgi:hypothetical protein